MTLYFLCGKKPFTYNTLRQLIITKTDLKDLRQLDPETSTIDRIYRKVVIARNEAILKRTLVAIVVRLLRSSQ
ncbi:hypothetical protein QFZ20_000160 [Flavobacterium sp. W4I14]|nr:hypothetical protein [Flavobacterium sp. W4I14]